ncbi:helix-turn-helix domain-containing protein [Actinokineospora sp. 24-640]
MDESNTFDKVADLGRDIGEYIRAQRSSAKISLRQLSRLAGVSNPYLSQIERGLRKPSAEILQQIAKGLRISAEALYVQAGILDMPAGGPVVDAVRAAEELTERQKQVLLDIYESFRRENTGGRDTATRKSTVEGSDVDGHDQTTDPAEEVSTHDAAQG